MLKTIHAKVKCNRIEDVTFEQGTRREVFFNPVSHGPGDNADFSKYTPSGEIRLQIDKDAPAYNSFKPGVEYLLTFSPVVNYGESTKPTAPTV